MYTYKTCLLLVYLLAFRWACSTQEPAAQAKTDVTVNLSKLGEHGSVNYQTLNHKVKYHTFTPNSDKNVVKVVYDNKEFWKSTDSQNKTFKQLVLTSKDNLLQLVDVVLVKSSEPSSQEEHVYYKKNQGVFENLNDSDYKTKKDNLSKNKSNYVDQVFPLDLHKKELYSGLTSDTFDVVDGTHKTLLNVRTGKPFVVRDQEKVLVDSSNNADKVSSVTKYDFPGNHLLVVNFRTNLPTKYFHKPSNGEWVSLADLNAFNTKANEYKSTFYGTRLDYNVDQKPDTEKFYLKRTKHTGNHVELHLYPYSNYYVGSLRHNGTAFWSSEDKNTRVSHFRMHLLGYDAQLLHLVLSTTSTDPFPNRDSKYYLKQADGTFKVLEKKDDFSSALNRLKSSADTNTPFTYRDDWVRSPATLNLSTLDPNHFTEQKTDKTNGASEHVLTPKANVTFSKLFFANVQLWPTTTQQAEDSVVTKLVLYKKHSLLQLVHMTGTRNKTGTDDSTGKETVELYFKKVEEGFATETPEEFNKLKLKLEEEDTLVDSYVHLDLNEDLNLKYFTVTSELVDGVEKKVVTTDKLMVTKLTNYRNTVWERPKDNTLLYLNKYEVHTVGLRKLLKLHLTNPAKNQYEKNFEKTDPNLGWVCTSVDFNAKLLEFKSPDNWTELELDVSVKPDAQKFNVVVEPLKGNRTKLTLRPYFEKKVTTVKHGTTKTFFTSTDKKRVYKVDLYLENYEAKFLKLYVWKDATKTEVQTTEDKHFKSGNGWVTDIFDTELQKFVSEDNSVSFAYNEKWELPPSKFDPESYSDKHFGVQEETAGSVKTTTYTPNTATVVQQVFHYGSKVWPEGEQPETSKKLLNLKVLSKNDMVQLLHLQNALVASPNTVEDLYYKKDTDKYVKLKDVAEFNKLKETLNQENTYVDDKVKLDLSSTAETSTKLFDKETTLEDGVEKTVLVVKVGKLFEVSASPPLWKSTDGSYVTKLERYVLDNMQLLVLDVTSPSGATEKKYFQKPVAAPAAPPASPPSPPTETPRDAGTGEQRVPETPQQPVPEVQHQPQPPPQAPAPAKPSFEPLTNKEAFFTKLNQAKAAVQHQEVTLSLDSYQDHTKFDVQQTTQGTATLYKLYPKKEYWVTAMNKGSENLWGKAKDGERLVEVQVYVHDTSPKFVRGVIWEKDHTDESQDQLLHFQRDGEKFVKKEKAEFEAALTQVTTVPPTPLKTETLPPPPVTTTVFNKLFLSDTFDKDVFELSERTKGSYKLKNFTVKPDRFVNAVETQHGVLWKAEDEGDFMKSSFFAVKEDSALAHLTLTVNTQPSHLFFKFENERWSKLDSNTYVQLYAGASLSQAQS